MMEHARALVSRARRVVVLTGAGISAESGVPTFRGPGGLWKTHRPEELATPQAFRADPRLVWEWYAFRRDTVAACHPNAGHRALAGFALGGREVRIVTQNVDGLHALAATEAAGAGSPEPAMPLELHGSLFRVRCVQCNWAAYHREPVDTSSPDALPRCPECGGMVRPAVVWFGESLEEHVLVEAFEAAEAADLCLVVGTSAVVHPAASVPLVTLRAGGSVVEVNPEETPLSPVAAVSLRGPSGEILPELLR